jgi:hypothetical protein
MYGLDAVEKSGCGCLMPEPRAHEGTAVEVFPCAGDHASPTSGRRGMIRPILMLAAAVTLRATLSQLGVDPQDL